MHPSGESLHVPVTVSLELEWVLRASFGFDKSAVTRTLSRLLSSVELTFESEGALELALVLYGQGAADFSDCLHVALASAAGEQPLWTFDKAAAKVAGARLLSIRAAHPRLQRVVRRSRLEAKPSRLVAGQAEQVRRE